MEPVKHRLSFLIREAVILPEENINIIPSCNKNKPKQIRKASTTSVQDDEQTKNRIRKHQPLPTETSEETSLVLRLADPGSFQSNNGGHLSTFEELIPEDESAIDEAAQHLTQIRLTEGQIREDLQRNEAVDSRKDDKSEGDMSLSVKEKAKTSNEEEENRMKLEEKLVQNDAFDVIGIMDLSSMNLTDGDIPLIIQRLFRKKRKKCFGLILRDNGLTSEGVKILVDSFLTMRTELKYLSFSDNPKIGDAGIEHLTRLLQNNRSMNFLAVPNTGMTDHGVRMLADTLCGINTHSPCAPLEKLYISFNQFITDESLEPVLQIIEQNRTLKVLSLRHCSLSNIARRRLSQVGIKMKKRKFSLAE